MDPESTSLNSMRPKRTYKDAISLLNTLQSNFATIEAAKSLSISAKQRSELSLNEVHEYVRRLGYRPSDFDRLNSIHVTGTKGKGSTCAFIESILTQYKRPGLISKIGLFTSPHLRSVRERIRIDGAPITGSKFTKYFFEVWDKLSNTTSDKCAFPALQPCEKVKPMYFKFLTILSFHIFMSEGVDTAIYEVGVGGKYDSTNIINEPTVAVITSLGIDHTAMLGNTIQSIAWNKAGIMKKRSPAIICEQTDYPESLEVVEKVAQENNVASLEVIRKDSIPADLKLGLAGDFQRLNAAVAVKAAQIHLKLLGMDVDPRNLPVEFKMGLKNTQWEGRCQTLQNITDFESVTWFIDGAHTMESIFVASKWFRDVVDEGHSPKILLFNQQSRENAKDLLEKLYQVVCVHSELKFDYVLFTTNVTWADGSYNADLVSINNSKNDIDRLVIQKELKQKWEELENTRSTQSDIQVFHDIESSLRFIQQLQPDNSRIQVFVCGSLHLVGGFLTVLDGKHG